MSSGLIDVIVRSLGFIGLLEPIILDTELNLICGRQRLEAVRQSGQTHVPAIVRDFDENEKEIAVIVSNLAQQPLTELEKCEQTKRLKDIYETFYPETRRGGYSRSKIGVNSDAKKSSEAAEGKTAKIVHYDFGAAINDKQSIVGLSVPSFAEVAAREQQVSARTVRRRSRIADKLSPKTKELIASHPIAQRLTQLEELADYPNHEQEDLAALLTEDKLSFNKAKVIVKGTHSQQNSVGENQDFRRDNSESLKDKEASFNGVSIISRFSRQLQDLLMTALRMSPGEWKSLGDELKAAEIRVEALKRFCLQMVNEIDGMQGSPEPPCEVATLKTSAQKSPPRNPSRAIKSSVQQNLF